MRNVTLLSVKTTCAGPRFPEGYKLPYCHLNQMTIGVFASHTIT